MAHALQHEVGGIDRVGDGLLSQECEELGDLTRRGCDGDVAQDARGEASAEARRLGCDLDREGLRGGLRGGQRGIERGEREVVDRRGFARDPVVVHGIDSVGGDVHLEEVAVTGAKIVDAFHRDATQGEVFGELTVVCRYSGDVGAQPFGENVHVKFVQFCC